VKAADRITGIRERLEKALRPTRLEVIDESHKHKGHAGARDGKGHFRVLIVADAFRGRGRVERHRLVYSALDDLLQTDIHALAVEASANEGEATAKG
jgi:BolA family transcriptional regulator, general stress-responsive regulator